MSDDMINHPPHYNHGKFETIKVIEDWGLDYHLGNCVKYISRAAHKGRELEDLKKARFYLDRKIELMETQSIGEQKEGAGPSPNAQPKPEKTASVPMAKVNPCPICDQAPTVEELADGHGKDSLWMIWCGWSSHYLRIEAHGLAEASAKWNRINYDSASCDEYLDTKKTRAAMRKKVFEERGIVTDDAEQVQTVPTLSESSEQWTKENELRDALYVTNAYGKRVRKCTMCDKPSNPSYDLSRCDDHRPAASLSDDGIFNL